MPGAERDCICLQERQVAPTQLWTPGLCPSVISWRVGRQLQNGKLQHVRSEFFGSTAHADVSFSVSLQEMAGI